MSPELRKQIENEIFGLGYKVTKYDNDLDFKESPPDGNDYNNLHVIVSVALTNLYILLGPEK